MRKPCPLYPRQRFSQRMRSRSDQEIKKSKNISACPQSVISTTPTKKQDASSHSLPRSGADMKLTQKTIAALALSEGKTETRF
jgi:hypothetical protein